MKFKLLFSYRFFVYFKCTRCLSATDQAWGLWHDALLHHFIQHVGHVLHGRYGFGACFVVVRLRASYLRMKGAVTMAIMITFVIYHFMLAPLATPEKFYRLENFLCHYIVPLMFFFDTLVIDKAKQYRKLDPFLWTLIPLAYMLFALLNGLILKWPIPGAKDSPFAYFFINVNKYGWAFVGKWVVIIFIAYLLAGYVLYGIKKNIKRK